MASKSDHAQVREVACRAAGRHAGAPTPASGCRFQGALVRKNIVGVTTGSVSKLQDCNRHSYIPLQPGSKTSSYYALYFRLHSLWVRWCGGYSSVAYAWRELLASSPKHGSLFSRASSAAVRPVQVTLPPGSPTALPAVLAHPRNPRELRVWGLGTAFVLEVSSVAGRWF